MRDCTHPLLPARQLVGLVLLIILCFSVSTYAEWIVVQRIDTWYSHLTRPAWYPPRWIFAPIWSAFYLLTAVAAWLVWRCGGVRPNRVPLTLFAVQLSLNIGWTWLLFRLQNPAAAFVDTLVWWAAMAATTASFARRSRWAGVLMGLCLVWLTFIANLNYAIWRLNS